MSGFDPYQELWRSLVDRVYKTREGFGGLSENERTYFAVMILGGEVHNGGMEQFFSNSSGEFYEEALQGLGKIGATSFQELLSRAAAILFGEKDPPKDVDERNDLMYLHTEEGDESLPDWSRELTEIDKYFWANFDALADLLQGFADAHELVAPFAGDENS